MSIEEQSRLGTTHFFSPIFTCRFSKGIRPKQKGKNHKIALHGVVAFQCTVARPKQVVSSALASDPLTISAVETGVCVESEIFGACLWDP